MPSLPPPAPALVQSPLALGLDAFEAVTACVHSGQANARATFEVSFTGAAEREPFLVFAGLEPLLDALEKLRFRPDDLEWLRNAGAIDDQTVQRLAQFRFTCDVDAPPEGSVVFPGEPVAIVEGPLWQAVMVEAFVISGLDAPTRWATHFARCALAAAPAEVIEVGSAHVHRLGGNALLGRAAFVGGAGATTNALAGRRYSVPVRARQPRSFVLALQSEVAAFDAWLRSVSDQAILRVDARDPYAGIERAVTAIRSRATASWSDAPAAIEIGGGDLVELARHASRTFERAGLRAPVLVVSGELEPCRIDELRRTGVPVVAFAVDGPADEAPWATWEIAAIESDGQWSPRARPGATTLASTLPGRKVALRYYDADGRAAGDLVHGASERHLSPKDARGVELASGFPLRLRDAASSAPIAQKAMRAGKRVASNEPTADARERARRSLELLPEPFRRLRAHVRYPVGATPALAALHTEVVAKMLEG